MFDSPNMLKAVKLDDRKMSFRQTINISNTSINLPEIHLRTTSLPDLVFWAHGKGKRRFSRSLLEMEPEEEQHPSLKFRQRTKTRRHTTKQLSESLESVKEAFEDIPISSQFDGKSAKKERDKTLPSIFQSSSRSLSKAPSTESVGKLSSRPLSKTSSNESRGYSEKNAKINMAIFKTVPMAIQRFRKNVEENNLKQKPATVGRRTSVTGWRKGSIILRRDLFNAQKSIFQKRMIRKFRLAVKLCIYCIRLIKAHSLRNKEHDDEISPFIKGLNFYEDEPVDLMFAKNDYKANRSMRIPEETKRILCKRPADRTEQELYSAQIALRNIKAIAEYPQNMQRKIAEVGQYERYEAKRILLRQGHPASAYYFVLSGQAVVMVMDPSRTYARPALHYNKGGEFGELAIIQGSKRNATIICKEPCELLSISKKDYRRIFMMGGEKSIGDPDQEEFIRSLNFLDGWPLQKLKEHPDKTKFLYFKRGDIVAQETLFYDWLIVVKTGSIRVLKKLKKVGPFEWKKKQTVVKFVSEKTKRINLEKREAFRRHILSELKVPLRNVEQDDEYVEEYPGKPRVFQHPSDKSSSTNHEPQEIGIQSPRNINGKRKRSSFQSIQGQFLPRLFEEGVLNLDTVDSTRIQKNSPRELAKKSEALSGKRRASMLEKEKERMGFKEHKRTIQEDIDGIKRKDPQDVTEADLKPEFVEIQILSKGQVFGLSDIILDQQPNFCIVSNGADLILIDKDFYLHHASDNLKNRMRQDLCPYPSDEEMQERLQRSVDWSAYRTITMSDTLSFLKAKRELRASLTA